MSRPTEPVCNLTVRVKRALRPNDAAQRGLAIHDFENGSITINGHSIKEEPVICKKMMAYIPDNPNLYEHMTGFQYINFIADLFEISTEIRRERIQKYSYLFEMTKHLSGMSWVPARPAPVPWS